MLPTNFHGWYSEEQAKKAGTSLYETIDGKLVEVTEASRTIESKLGTYLDTVYIGPLTRLVRGDHSRLHHQLMSFDRFRSNILESGVVAGGEECDAPIVIEALERFRQRKANQDEQ